jgi:hypothetical protein
MKQGGRLRLSKPNEEVSIWLVDSRNSQSELAGLLPELRKKLNISDITI